MQFDEPIMGKSASSPTPREIVSSSGSLLPLVNAELSHNQPRFAELLIF